MNQNESHIKPLLEKLKAKCGQPFSMKREHDIDDIFAELLRAKLTAGSKSLKEEAHRGGIRTRLFTYESDDGRCHIYVSFTIKQGDPGKSSYRALAKFNGK